MVTNDMWKFVLLGLPAVVALLLWRNAGVTNKTMYSLSWASPLGYLAWLLGLTSVRHISPQRLGGWISDSATGMLVSAPLFGMLLSLVLLGCVFFAAKPQRSKMASSNAFMLVLWLSSLIAPN